MTTSESQGREPANRRALPASIARPARAVALDLAIDDTPHLAKPLAPPLAPTAPLTPVEVRGILLSLLLAMFLAALDQTIVATALPTIGRQFHDVSSLSWVITAYLLASTAVAPVFGTLSDIFGRRATIIIAMGLFIAGSVLCALAPNIGVLIVARGLQGLGGGGILPIVQTVISDVVSPRERGQYQAYFSGVWVSASIGGPVIGGVFAEHLHWSLIFWINLPLGVGALALLLPKMGKIPVFHRRRKVDWLGGLLLMAAAVVVMLVLTWGGTRFSWSSPTILAMAGAAALLGLGFVWHALRTAEPFLPLQLMDGSVVPYAMAAGGCAIGVLIGLTVSMPLYYEVVYGLSASASGLALIPIVAVSVLGAAFSGRATTRWTHYKRVAIAGNAFSAVMCCALAVATPLPLWTLLAMLALLSVGIGTVFPVSLVSIQNAVPRDQIGTATGAMNFFRALMASFAVAAFTAILLAVLGSDVPIGREHTDAIAAISPGAMVAAFRYVFVASAALMAMAALAMLVMEERPLAGPEISADLAE
ncbi:MAG TPA: MDR family MFS transporter [Rhodopseudomonas sp.]|uniref:MDR family MFS transporter n=1 Tax=Rhodopseudomonas sp. TaxID=1078 RepID=UPI002ED849A4